jgi:hypothetical protein
MGGNVTILKAIKNRGEFFHVSRQPGSKMQMGVKLFHAFFGFHFGHGVYTLASV